MASGGRPVHLQQDKDQDGKQGHGRDQRHKPLLVARLEVGRHQPPGKHDGKDDQDGDGPDVDQELDHGQELGLQQDVEASHTHEREHQKECGAEQVAGE